MNEQEFSAFWKLLCEAKGRTPSAPLTRMYALIVQSENVTAEQWITACTHAIRFSAFMPTPQELINFAQGQDFKTVALEAWDVALLAVRQDVRAEITSEARRILNSATNGQGLGMVDLKHFPFVKKEFLERYADHLAKEASARTPNLLAPAQNRELTSDAR